MATWRIRISLSDDAETRAKLAEVLATQQVSAVRLTQRSVTCAGTGTGTGAGSGSGSGSEYESELAGDVLMELPRDDELGEMLSALHMISPQVFVSRARSDDDETSSGALPGSDRRAVLGA
ncbi:MAG: hypothetical protein J2P29_14680 [Actinobacteria bacterium]|nr:hypothetical protein [Actinomycetota bacterium]